jgi:hypothetical protein
MLKNILATSFRKHAGDYITERNVGIDTGRFIFIDAGGEVPIQIGAQEALDL